MRVGEKLEYVFLNLLHVGWHVKLGIKYHLIEVLLLGIRGTTNNRYIGKGKVVFWLGLCTPGTGTEVARDSRKFRVPIRKFFKLWKVPGRFTNVVPVPVPHRNFFNGTPLPRCCTTGVHMLQRLRVQYRYEYRREHAEFFMGTCNTPSMVLYERNFAHRSSFSVKRIAEVAPKCLRKNACFDVVEHKLFKIVPMWVM